MSRRHPGAYRRALAALDPAARRAVEGSLAGLRFIRGQLGYSADPGDFIQPALEQWTFPDGSRILELSTRCPPHAILPVTARMAAVLRAHGVDLTGPQQTKTHATLDFFSTCPETPANDR